ncbi:hypothetical protein TIFTF001_021246 [Ficus carica]|uniref:Uncharacterized protein n=1 Tax=Ficus carica TaxID=3494 RepID=A0AA88ASC7_FICCA|nr:hypothetical protein TIFTF001_021246 [Ficus carica]
MGIDWETQQRLQILFILDDGAVTRTSFPLNPLLMHRWYVDETAWFDESMVCPEKLIYRRCKNNLELYPVHLCFGC